MTVNITRFLFAAALVCFVVAFILAVGWVNGGNYPAWVAGGLGLFTAAHLT